jgi:DnaJ-class molecular chaperone
VDVAITLLLRNFPDADVPFRSRAQAAPAPSRNDEPFAVLHLRETAPVELIEASYRTLARLYHPDTGGDLLTMQRINGAYAALKARVPA